MVDFKKGNVHLNYLKEFFDDENIHFSTSCQTILEVWFGEYSIEVLSDYPSTPQVMIKKDSDREKKLIVKQDVADKEDMYNVLKHYIDLLESFQETLRTQG